MNVTGDQLCARCAHFAECEPFIGEVRRAARVIDSLEARARRQFGADELAIVCRRYNGRRDWRVECG